MPYKKNQVILLISFLLIAGFLATSLASYFSSRASLRAEIEETALPLTSDNIYSEIQRDLFRPIFISSLMASDTFLRDWVLGGETDPAQMTRYLREIQSKYGTFTSFFVSEASRNYYHTGGILKQVDAGAERDQWYFRVRQMANDYEINLDPDLANRDALTIFINYKVFDYDGNFIGAAGVGLTVDAVKSLIENYQQRYQRNIFFVDRQGQITLSSAAFADQGQRLQELPGLAPLAERILAAEHLSLKYQRDGKTVHLNTRYIQEFDWLLLVEQTESTLLQPIFRTLIANLWICALISALVLLLTHRTLTSYQQRVESLAATDKLTGAYNRNAFDALFGQAKADCQRSGQPLSMLLLDLDHFKKVNDSFGHHAGDAVLVGVAQRLRACIREADMLFRWGGEEFLIVLKDCPQQRAMQLAETLRQQVQQQPLQYEGRSISVTASLGVAQHRPQEGVDQLFVRVDQALYSAKAKGRNRAEAADDPCLSAAELGPAEA